MIKIEEINQLIEQEKEKLKPDSEKEIQLEQQINHTIAEFTIAVDDGNCEEAERLRDRITALKTELSEVQDLNLAKESGAYKAALKGHSKLGKLVKEYEQQQFKIAESILADEEKLAEKVKKTVDNLTSTIKCMREKRREIGEVLQHLNYLQERMGNSGCYPNSDAYEVMKRKMTEFNYRTMADKVKRAGGLFC